MYTDLADTIFSDSTKEIIFYAACLTLYRLNLLLSNSIIPQNLKRFKWHMLPLARMIIAGKENQALNSKQIEKAAEKIVDVLAQHSAAATDLFTQIAKICQEMGPVTYDQLKRTTMLSDMAAKVPDA